MKQMLITLAALIAITATAPARVGETEDEITARYGWPVRNGENRTDPFGNRIRTYDFHDFTIFVTFVNGRSELEEFVKFKDHIPADRWEKLAAER